MNVLLKLLLPLVILLVIGTISYTVIGTSENVETIKVLAPKEMSKRGWKIMRYEGFQYGSWATHGGTVWYHVCNIDNPNIQYRVHISLWNGELQYYYKAPEDLSRIEIKSE